MNAINRVFLFALAVGVGYFGFEFLFSSFAFSSSVQRVAYSLLSIVFAPALPIRLLFPRLSLTVYLIVACLGWGLLAQLYRVIGQRIRNRLIGSH